MIHEYIYFVDDNPNGTSGMTEEEIIRCRDCKWRDKIGCALSIVDDSDKPNDDDYCSFAERMESDEE